MLEDQDAELSIAGNQDSYYEYMLKMWLLVKVCFQTTAFPPFA